MGTMPSTRSGANAAAPQTNGCAPIVPDEDRRLQLQCIEEPDCVFGKVHRVVRSIGHQGVRVIATKVWHDGSVTRVVQSPCDSCIGLRRVGEAMNQYDDRPLPSVGVAPGLPAARDVIEIGFGEHEQWLADRCRQYGSYPPGPNPFKDELTWIGTKRTNEHASWKP